MPGCFPVGRAARAVGCLWPLLLMAPVAQAGDAHSLLGFPVAALQSFRDAPDAPEMVVIPPGNYWMGSTEAETTREQRAAGPAAFERPRHLETIAQAFAIGKYLVTVAQFDRFVQATHRAVFEGCMVDDQGQWALQKQRSYLDPGFAQTDDHPAVCVTWPDAQAYVDWLGRETGHAYRLIEEREFEYAARAGTQTARWWGDSQDGLCRHANAADRSFDKAYPGDEQAHLGCDDGYAATSPVGAFPPNPYGLYDMAGNAWEWMGGCFRDSEGPASAPEADVACQRRPIRGGSWHNDPNVIRSATRFWLPPTMRASSTGFRVARDPG